MQKRYEQACPIARTLDLIGDRWTLLILRDLFMGQTRFNALLSSSPGMTPRMLSHRLKFLAGNGFITRQVQGGFPPRSEYALTDRGRSLFPILKTIGEWGVDHLYEGEEDVRDAVVAAIRSVAPEFTEGERERRPRRGGSRTARTTPREPAKAR
jgi:DNA-binding HxlR family transcriptional regulator